MRLGCFSRGTTLAIALAMNLTAREAGRLLGLAEHVVYRWIREKSIQFHPVEHYRFHRAELLAWATSRGTRIGSREFAVPTTNGTAPPQFADALGTGGVYSRGPGTERSSVLRAVVARMPIELADHELVYDFLVAREALGSTGIGEGIAIPHTLFSVVGPTIRGQLFLLSRIAAAMHDAAFKAAIVKRAPQEEVLREARRPEGSLPPPQGASAT